MSLVIRSFQIEGLKGLDQDEPTVLEKNFVVVSGRNGAGKTTLLEALALLGHSPEIPWRDEVGQPLATVRLCYRLGPHEHHVAFHSSDPDHLTVALAEGKFEHWWATADETSDVSLRKEDYEKLQDEIRYSRPKKVDAGEKQEHSVFSRDNGKKGRLRPPKRIKDLRKKREGFVPPHSFMSYANTDMYDYGVGMDLRESPKHLKETLAATVVRRFHAIEDPRGPSARLLGAERLRRAWRKIQDPKLDDDDDLTKLVARDLHDVTFQYFKPRPEGADPDAPREPWPVGEPWPDEAYGDEITATVTMGPTDKPRAVDFLSSGENEILSLLILTECLEASGCVFLLDEPELHLSPLNQYHFYEYLVDLTKERIERRKKGKIGGCQIIMTTHSQFALANYERVTNLFLDIDESGKTQVLVGKEARDKLVREWSTLSSLIDITYAPVDL
ncbi:MAG: AAA family ATPase [Myxococcota bacterium]